MIIYRLFLLTKLKLESILYKMLTCGAVSGETRLEAEKEIMPKIGISKPASTAHCRTKCR